MPDILHNRSPEPAVFLPSLKSLLEARKGASPAKGASR